VDQGNIRFSGAIGVDATGSVPVQGCLERAVTRLSWGIWKTGSPENKSTGKSFQEAYAKWSRSRELN